jgi:hypothetical protein
MGLLRKNLSGVPEYMCLMHFLTSIFQQKRQKNFVKKIYTASLWHINKKDWKVFQSTRLLNNDDYITIVIGI